MLLQDTGLTRTQLARLLLISKSTIAEWEQGVSYPAFKHRKRIERLLGVKVEWDADAPYSKAEREAIWRFLQDICVHAGLHFTCIFGLSKSRSEMRSFIRDFEYLNNAKGENKLWDLLSIHQQI